MTAFAELVTATNFSFLRGASHPEELVTQAAELELAGIAVADRNTLAGVVRGHVAAKEAGFPYRVGCRLVFRDRTPDIVAWPTDRAAYGRLCRLLTLGNRRAEKGDCLLDRDDLLAWGEGMMFAVMPGARLDNPPSPIAPNVTIGSPSRSSPRKREPSDGEVSETVVSLDPRFRGDEREGESPLATTLAALVDAFPGMVRLLATRPYGASDHRRLARLARLARHYGVPLLATNDVLYHLPERRMLQDVVTCIREHTTLAAAGRLLAANAERHLKGAAEMARLFHDYPEAVAESRAVLERLAFSLDELRYQYPDEPVAGAASPQEALESLTEEGARRRYPDGVPAKVRASIAHELALIRDKDYAPYFLTVYDIIRFAREERGILCQGRGSAANSAVCFCLGITEVDPAMTDLLFERFVSAERNEPPDIDVDFEHERREEVMQYVYEKYGRERAGIAATVITYRSRSAVREVGKVFGLSEDAVGALSGTVWGWSSGGVREEDVRRTGLDPRERTLARVLALTREIGGFPRHLSQHVGGFVITRDRLDEVVPVMNAAMEERTHVEWDKDDLDALGILKVDVLALGMLSCIRKAFEFLDRHYDTRPTLASIPQADAAVYRMLCRADSLGVFQVESRAQMSMLPRLKPVTFYDLVIEVAIVRPGPIQGDMVHPYLKRRQNPASVSYPSPELEAVLKKTMGVPLFQEQAMKIAIIAAGFTPGEADQLRRAMATFRRLGTIGSFRDKFIAGMVARNYPRDFAERCFRQIEGFGDYGFPESHAASFALLVYASAWLKCHYPDVFCAALLNAQPMGFYAPAQIVRDAREHGVEVRPVDVNFSDWDCMLEPEMSSGDPAAGALTPSSPRIRSGAGSPPFRGRRDGKNAASSCEDYGQPEQKGALGSSVRTPAEDAATMTPSHPPPFRGRGRSGADGASFFEVEAGFDTFPKGMADSPTDEFEPSRQEKTERPHRVPPPERGRTGGGHPTAGKGRGQSDETRGAGPPSPAMPQVGPAAARPLHARHAEMAGDIRTHHAVRLGFREIKGFAEEDAKKLAAARGAGYDSVRDLWLRSGLTRAAIERLADADAFRSLGLDRRDALWAARDLGARSDDRLPLFDTDALADIRREPDFALPPMPIGEHVVNDYRALGLSLKAHPVSFLRTDLATRGIAANERLGDTPDGRRITVAGLVLVRQRPGTAKGVIFMTIEDETGIANVIVWPKTFERFRPVVLGARLVAVSGRLQSESGVIHVVADRLDDLTPMLATLSEDAGDMESLARADEVRRPSADMREKVSHRGALARRIKKDMTVLAEFAERSAEAMPKGRNFH